MDTFLTWVFTALPFMVVLLLAVLAVAGIAIGIVWPRFLLYPYLCIFFWINSTSYGSLSVFASASVYARGSGLLYFGLVLWYLLGAWCCARVASSFQGLAAPPCNLRPWFLGWLLLLGGHVAVALFSGISLKQALAPSGFANIVWMAPLISLMLLSFRTRAHLAGLARFIMLAGLARALFGLGRWAVLGGDPNNIYANVNAIKIRLTFFDINDSLLCCMAFAIAAVNLFQAARTPRARAWTGLEWLTLGATSLCIVLSYRRSAWIGFVLAVALVMLRFPPRRRVQLIVLGLPVVGAALLTVAVARLGQTKAAAGQGLASLVYDMESRRFGAESERVLELKLALADFLSHPVTGIGAWGRYTGYQRISWQLSEDGGLFLHSGVLHLALKSGLLGIVLFTGLALAFVAVARRALRQLPPEYLGLGAAGVAGVAFMLPDLLVGTPIPQVRTTQMLAVCMALPYLALAVSGAPPAAARAPHLGRTKLVPV
jgi:hypothetical protein